MSNPSPQEQWADEGAQLRSAAARVAPQVAAAVVDVLMGASVVAGLVTMVGDVARVMAVTSSGFVLIELSQSGDRFVVACPLWRLRRVAEMSINGVTTITIELEADKMVVRQEPDGSSVVLPGAYEVSAVTGQAGDLLRFASKLRQALLSGE